MMTFDYGTTRRRGTALLLAIVMTMLLFIIGFAFLTNTQTTLQTVKGLDRAATLDAGIDAVVAQINKVLVEDLVGPGLDGNYGTADDTLLDGSANNEYYDYPGPDDPWLASLEPEYFNDGTDEFYFWRHISDIYGNNFGGVPIVPDPFYYDPDDDTDNAQMDSGQPLSWWYWVVNFTGVASSPHKYTVAKIVDEENDRIGLLKDGSNSDPDWPNEWGWGARADADGDGVADARWVKVPDITGSNGETIYAAVRIIDNCGMININTAYANSGNLSPPTSWDGSLLTHVNLDTYPAGTSSFTYSNPGLIGMRAISEPTTMTIDDLHAARCGFPASLPDSQVFHDELASRVGNPDYTTSTINYQPFDISDELELRNRYFIDSNVEARLGFNDGTNALWQVTFNPGPGTVGAVNPYEPSQDIDAWFDKATSTETASSEGWAPIAAMAKIFNYNRRTISTTYSFDRVITPRPNTWPPTSPNVMPDYMVTAWNTWNNWGDLTPLNWKYKPVNINRLSTPPTTSELEVLAAAIWLGLPNGTFLNTLPQFTSITPAWTPNEVRERLACQLVANLSDSIDSDLVSTDFNPTGSGSANHFYGHEPEGDNLYIVRLGLSLKDVTGTTEMHYAIQLYNPHVSTKVVLNNWSIVNVTKSETYLLPTVDVLADDVLVLIDNDDIDGFVSSEGSPIAGGPTFQFDSGDRLVLRDPAGRPCDAIEVAVLPSLASGPGVREVYFTEERVGVLTGVMSSEVPAWELEPLWGIAPDTSGIGDLANSYDFSTSVLTNSGAMFQTSKVPNNDFVNVGEFSNLLAMGCADLGGTYVTITELLEFIRTDTVTTSANDIDVVTAAHIDLQDNNFSGLLRYLTISNFEPFNDTVDNDKDGFVDDADVIDPELDIAGRININTAPWFVIAQLPWIQEPILVNDDPEKFKLPHAITAYRDKVNISGPVFVGGTDWAGPDFSTRTDGPGFTHVGDLLNVTGTSDRYDIHYYENVDIGNLVISMPGTPTPEYTTDFVGDDLEERDVIFHRVSNLATVRSDVFTAYILVRVGELGPQKRVIAIFDRTNVFAAGDTPKLVALHPVPDPR